MMNFSIYFTFGKIFVNFNEFYNGYEYTEQLRYEQITVYLQVNRSQYKYMKQLNLASKEAVSN